VQLKKSMAELYININDTLPIVVNKKSFEDPKNKKIIATRMNQLKQLAKAMSKENKRFADSDPSISFITERFEEDIQYAIDMWNTGDRIISRKIMRNATDYCISCHTRTGRGAMFSHLNQPKGFASLPKVDRAEYFLATRQYDQAIALYEKILMDGILAKQDPLTWIQSIKKLLSVTIRVKHHASLTLEMISRIQERPDAHSDKFAPMIAAWRKSTQEWAAQEATKPGSKTDDTQQLSLASIASEVIQGENLEKSLSGAGLVHFLKASNNIHKLLSKTPKINQSADILLLAGRAASHLTELNLGLLHEVYFEQCVIATGSLSDRKECFAQLEAAYLRNFGVDGKSKLPLYLQNRMNQLQEKLTSTKK
jgi:hypothetical protein